MLKQLALCAVLLVPLAAFADEQAPDDASDGSEKGICEDIGGNFFKCQQMIISGVCKWDVADGRCETITGGICATILDRPTCNFQPSCHWDSFEGRCESL